MDCCHPMPVGREQAMEAGTCQHLHQQSPPHPPRPWATTCRVSRSRRPEGLLRRSFGPSSEHGTRRLQRDPSRLGSREAPVARAPVSRIPPHSPRHPAPREPVAPALRPHAGRVVQSWPRSGENTSARHWARALPPPQQALRRPRPLPRPPGVVRPRQPPPPLLWGARRCRRCSLWRPRCPPPPRWRVESRPWRRRQRRSRRLGRR
mmetsp:Transcript_47405/g.152200  ORF Transcript_47405/g.152200 Transcript_47405/m.152200 type:complete len:206 (+) Transcript_47405:483-1100(+)